MDDAITPSPPTAATPALAEPPRSSNRSAMMIVFLVVFIDLLGFGIILPLLPRIAEAYVKVVFPNPAWLVGLIVGILMSLFSLMQFVFAPIWGRVSDRIGRRPILLVGLLGSVVFYSLFGYAASLPHNNAAAATTAMLLFFIARIGAGVAGATISTAQAVIADCTPPEKRKHGMALIGAAFGIGFTFGPLIGYACMHYSDAFPTIGQGLIGYTAAALSGLALLLGIVLLRETHVFNTQSIERRDWGAMINTLGDPAIGPVVLTFFMASLGFGAFEVTLSLFLKDVFGLGEDQSFLFFAYIGFALMVTQGLYRGMASRVSEVTFMGLGILFMALGVGMQGAICYAWWQSIAVDGLTPYLYVSLTAAVVGFAFLTPSAQALISRRTSADRQGEILGVNQSASAMARILGPILGVTLYKATDDHLWPFIAGAVLLVLMFPMLPRIKRGE